MPTPEEVKYKISLIQGSYQLEQFIITYKPSIMSFAKIDVDYDNEMDTIIKRAISTLNEHLRCGSVIRKQYQKLFTIEELAIDKYDNLILPLEPYEDLYPVQNVELTHVSDGSQIDFKYKGAGLLKLLVSSSDVKLDEITLRAMIDVGYETSAFPSNLLSIIERLTVFYYENRGNYKASIPDDILSDIKRDKKNYRDMQVFM